MKKHALFATALSTLVALGLMSAPASATIVYGTSIEGANLFKYDTATDTLTTVADLGAIGRNADSMVFDNQGRIIYSAISAGEVRRYDPATNSDVLLANGFNTPADLLLDIGGGSVLVSEFGSGKVDRIDLTTLSVSLLASGLGNPEGLAYDSTGKLYVNVGDRNGGAAGKKVVELNPLTGGQIRESAGLNSLDGLTYDAVTDKLYASSLFGNTIIALDPLTLTATTLINASLPNPDGISSDGQGNLFIAARGDFTIYKYNLSTNTQTVVKTVFGLDDLAPVAGLGSNDRLPVPGSVTLLAFGLAGLGAARRKRQL